MRENFRFFADYVKANVFLLSKETVGVLRRWESKTIWFVIRSDERITLETSAF